MKKVFSLTVFLLTCFLFLISQTKADSCSYKEQQALNKEASNINFNYELVDKLEEVDNLPKGTWHNTADYYYIQILLSNIGENIYVEITNDKDDNKLTFYNSDLTDGLVTFKKEINEVVKYKMTIYANTTNCQSKLNTKTLIVPKFNTFYNIGDCKDIPEYKYCQKLITSTLSDNSLGEKIHTYYTNTLLKKDNQPTKTENDYLKYILIISSSLLVLLVIFIIFRFILKKRRKI